MVPLKNRSLAVLIVLLLCFGTSVRAEEPYNHLEAFEHEFKMTLSGFRVTAVRSLKQRENGTYEFRLRAKNLVARYEEKSLFEVDETGQIFPLQHSVSTKVFGVSRSENTLFDWATNQATYTKKDTVRTAEIETGVLDRALYQLLIPRDLNEGSEQVSYDFIDRGRAKNYEFAIVAEEQIELDDTDIMAVRMNRVNEEDEDKETDIWFAKEHGYQLVKISHVDKDGSDYHMVLKDSL